ncbi:hypothetical protein RJ639_018871 [Escallonia herrerae]|uniref:Protein arginine methyltransferase NDUFAF7 n=1 Tax=Escallonia herrerae TaxID=1293975 RepID=A0AA89AJ71_9ASTE|nr:hypothetical protein RJ639_018871 [Escallonia herrerae]
MLRRILAQASTHRCRLFAPASSRQCSSSPSSSQIPQRTFVEHLEDNPNLPDEATPNPSAKLSVDRSGLYLVHPSPLYFSIYLLRRHSHEPSSDSELVKHLKGIIKFRGGPISVAEYMEEVLTNPKAGFYINRDVFGAEGDFITSPEVSQMFGEMIGVWATCLWEQMGQPNKVNLVELGPGRGTLMVDLLRGSSKFKSFIQSLHIHMVECSPKLRKLQHLNLKCTDEDDTCENVEKQIVSTLSGTPVSWHAALEQVPTGFPTIIIAHEFYDALPVHQFQAIRKHKFVDILDEPGSADLSVYVDFAAVKHSAEEISDQEFEKIITFNFLTDVSIHGLITQSQFLGSLGINFRVEALLQNCTEEQAESLRTGYWRLVGEGEAPFWEGPDEQAPIGMGTRYLAMAIVNKKQGAFVFPSAQRLRNWTGIGSKQDRHFPVARLKVNEKKRKIKKVNERH